MEKYILKFGPVVGSCPVSADCFTGHLILESNYPRIPGRPFSMKGARYHVIECFQYSDEMAKKLKLDPEHVFISERTHL